MHSLRKAGNILKLIVYRSSMRGPLEKVEREMHSLHEAENILKLIVYRSSMRDPVENAKWKAKLESAITAHFDSRISAICSQKARDSPWCPAPVIIDIRSMYRIDIEMPSVLTSPESV